MGDVRVVLVPVSRWPRWRENFAAAHGETSTSVVDGALLGQAADGSTFEARRSLGRGWDEQALEPRGAWGLLLVRRGGFAMARLTGERVQATKVGRRHVQGRTKAGGQSQQRFARRRDNQARVAWEAAAGHAITVLGDAPVLVVEGDRSGIEAVLDDPRLRGREVVEPWLAVPDPTRAVLVRALVDAASVQVRVHNR